MYEFKRDAGHKLRVLRHADQIGDIGKACRYFGVGRASFYRWQTTYRQLGMAGLENRKTAITGFASICRNSSMPTTLQSA